MNDHLDCNSDDDATDCNLSSFDDELQFDNDVDHQSAMEDAKCYKMADLCQVRIGISVELLGSPYYKGVPIPRIPSVRKLGMKSRIAQWSEHASVRSQGTYSHAGQSTTEPRKQCSRSVGTAQYASTIRIPRSRAVLDPARHTNGISRWSNARRVTL